MYDDLSIRLFFIVKLGLNHLYLWIGFLDLPNQMCMIFNFNWQLTSQCKIMLPRFTRLYLIIIQLYIDSLFLKLVYGQKYKLEVLGSSQIEAKIVYLFCFFFFRNQA